MGSNFWSRPTRLPLISPVGEFSHASHPVAQHLQGDRFLVVFSRRDRQNRSHLFGCEVSVRLGEIKLSGEFRLLASPGRAGTFDCDGVIPCNFVADGNKLFLYYCGWHNLPNGLWICDSGRLIVKPEEMSAVREFEGPIFGRDKHNPLFAVATAVARLQEGKWICWYNKGLEWFFEEGKWEARYGLHIAESHDGLAWSSREGMVVPFVDAQEHSIGRPSVLIDNGRFHMWFGCRGALGFSQYRMGYAESTDGYNWRRDDSRAGVLPSGSGWDSDAVTYPSIFYHDGYYYLLYCGNSYGKTGFGYQVLHKTEFSTHYGRAIETDQ